MPITIEDEIAVFQDDLVDMRGNASRSPIHLGDGDVAAIRRLAGIRRRPGAGHITNAINLYMIRDLPSRFRASIPLG